ncbi:MAG: DMT family transporter [Candidatus Vogelbacteria bacterium]
MKISKYATVLALSTALISGTANFVNKFAVSGFSNPVLFTTIKNSLVAIFILGIFIAIKRWPEIKRLTAQQWRRLVLVGIIGGALPFALFFTGLAQTSAINGALIHKTLFLFVALLAIPFLKERLAWQQWLGVGIIFIANLFVGGFTGFKFNAGELMILAATILWAIENIIAKKALANISSLTVVGARMIFGSILLASYIALSSGFGETLNLSDAKWGWLILTAGLLAGYVLTWYTALKHAPATYVATLLVPATLVTNVLSALFVTHTFSINDLATTILYAIGIGLVIYYAQLTFKKCEPQLMHGS